MRWSDNKGRLPFAVIVLIAAFAQPAFLFLAWKFDVAPAQITTANDLASIMGAIFTAGGLVVALVSIYTMANVETVTKNAVKPLLDAVPQEIDSRIRRFLEAYKLLNAGKRTTRSRRYKPG